MNQLRKLRKSIMGGITSGENENLDAIAGHLYDINKALRANNSILKEKLSGIEDELHLTRRDFDILVGLSTPEIELMIRKKELVKKEIDSYSVYFPDECVEERDKLEEEYEELEQSIEKAKNQLYKDIKGVKNEQG